MKENIIKNIEDLTAKGEYDEALKLLSEAIAENPEDDRLYVSRGKIFWRLGHRSQATSDYSTALHLNPDSPARHLLEMAQDVEAFFNPDLLNP